MHLFTEFNFSDAIHCLDRACSECFETQNEEYDEPMDYRDRCLHCWRMECSEESPYLVHDTVAIADCSNNYIGGDNDDHDLYEKVLMDNESTRIPFLHRHPNRIIEFSFSVCFSHVWSVPVLYFRAQDLYGQMISRARLLQFIKQGRMIATGDTDNIDWDENNFISEEEHPVTGTPCFFLHPCETATRLHTLSLSIREDSDHDTRFYSLLILSWLCMVLPAIQFRMSPIFFNQLVNKIKSLPITEGRN